MKKEMEQFKLAAVLFSIILIASASVFGVISWYPILLWPSLAIGVFAWCYWMAGRHNE